MFKEPKSIFSRGRLPAILALSKRPRRRTGRSKASGSILDRRLAPHLESRIGQVRYRVILNLSQHGTVTPGLP